MWCKSRAQVLKAPWYVPIAATAGAVLLVASLWQRRTVWRILALVLVALLAGAEWAMLLGMRLPAYTGPVAEGKPFPAFATARADGTPFTQADLTGAAEQRAGLLPRPVVTDLHDRAGSARTAA